MARLNEPVVGATESIDTLKRKFLRQNREIAKVNSTQAMRIRALENEVSRLLTDNLNSRGHIIRLERDLESSRIRNQNVDDLRSQMEVKLAELGALFKGFDGRPSPKKRRSVSPKENNKMIRSTPAKSPGTKDWKNACAIGAAMPGQEGRFPPSLPAIMENKYYPRKTLEQDELAALKEAADTTDSPELEPPPISQFIDEDPVKIDLPVVGSKSQVDAPTKSSSPTKLTTAMLEQRRKRRESVGMTDIRRLSGDEAMIRDETPDSLRVGAKRKISVRDDEERPSNAQVSPDDFKFTRKRAIDEQAPAATITAEKALIRHPQEIAPGKESSRDRSKLGTAQNSGRRALAPKQTNEYLSNSPRKKTKTPLLDEISAAKKDHLKSAPLLDRPRPRARPNKIENIPTKAAHPLAVSKVDVLPDVAPAQESEIEPEPATEQEPETPATQDIISPLFSEPSARPLTRDTPPPTDLGKGSAQDVGRPGRRARASVSYAEPNLRDKMRRPTKELVDAVAPKPVTYIKIEDGEDKVNSSVKSSGKPVYIKPEPVDDDDVWKSATSNLPSQDPPSPLSGKAPVMPDKTAPNDAEQRPKSALSNSSSLKALKDAESVSSRRARIENMDQPKLSRSAPSLQTISSARHSRQQAISGLNKDLSKLDIYDFDPTSPDDLDPKEQIRKFVALEESAAASKNTGSKTEESNTGSSVNRGTVTHLTRKNSSTKRNSALPLQMTEGSAGEESDVEGPKKRDIATRRRSVAAYSSSTSALSSVSDLKTGSGSVNGRKAGLGSKEVSDMADGSARQERVNARRRSMML